MDRTAWILNLREPFGAALGRELVSRGWNVIGGDPGAEGETGERSVSASSAGEAGLEQGRGEGGYASAGPAPEAEGAKFSPGRPRAGDIEEPGGASGWTHGPHIGENADIPSGTGASGLSDFEGSVGYGPESGERPKPGAQAESAGIEAGEAREAEAVSEASDESGAFAAVDEPGTAGGTAGAFEAVDEPGAASGAANLSGAAAGPEAVGSAADRTGIANDAETAADSPAADFTAAGERGGAEVSGALPEHGRLHALPLAAGRPGALEEAARLTADLAGRIDLLVLNAGEIVPAQPADRSEASSALGGEEGGETTQSRLSDYETYALTPLRAVSALLPLMEDGGGLKRICFVSSREGSISAGGGEESPVGRAMARTALHMQAKLLFNDLGRDGYTFRLYDPGLNGRHGAAAAPGSSAPGPGADTHGGSASAPAEHSRPAASLPASIAESARFAAGFFANPHADEERLVLTGSRGEEWPF
ncbi:hypothetical protein QWJ34_15160 [Saccharibacillus sp. CPCC 101409]|uniref:hypothetical protein n=1 Tax=Saccharibacillus sp. CPCC 101409 TaxID=3058041 RepID=UPI00267296EE|nr:hypothetical protein [Saccharibacillus sp. CPCC 101409]MDO3411103.1 hypothetical protein [Saccharibacillus sp. CPCC 101409]